MANNTSRSKTILICPVSLARQTRYLDEDAPGEFVTVEDAEDLLALLPVGWGRLTVEQVVRNPEIDEVEDAREAARMAGEADINAILESNTPEAEKAPLRRRVEDGSILADIEAAVEQQHPYPTEATVVQRLRFSSLSPAGILAVLRALAGVGLPIADIEAPPVEAPAATPQAAETAVATAPAEAPAEAAPTPPADSDTVDEAKPAVKDEARASKKLGKKA